MSKRWTFEEDVYLHEYFDTLDDFLGTQDLGRPAGAATKRAKALKASGAWDALTRMKQAKTEYLRLTGVRMLDDESEAA